MIMIGAVCAAVVLGYLLGGRLKYYLRRPFKWILLPALAFLVEALFGLLAKRFPPERWLPLATCLEYAILEAFLIANHDRAGVRVLGLGTALNFLAIATNGFSMPVTPIIHHYPELSGLVESVRAGTLPEYVLVDWNAPLWFLSDTLPMFGGVASVGDMIMAYGMLILVLDVMTQPKPKRPPEAKITETRHAKPSNRTARKHEPRRTTPQRAHRPINSRSRQQRKRSFL